MYACRQGLAGALALLAVGGAGCVGEDEAGKPAIDEPTEQVSSAIAINGHDYLFFHTPRTWAEARAVCPSSGFHLASLTTMSEATAVINEAQRHASGVWWFGYTDQATEMMWSWEGGGPFVSFTNWASGEPNNWNNNEDCATFATSTGKWNDLACTATAPFVCEHETVPTGAATTLQYSANDTIDATRNYVQFSFAAPAGRAITFGTCGLPGGSFSGDTYLRVYTIGGQQLAQNDDACGDLGSNISFVAPWTTTYVIRAGCYFDTACSGVIAMNFP